MNRILSSLLSFALSGGLVASGFLVLSCSRPAETDSAKPPVSLRERRQPVLNWEPRSDWRSVKEFGAVGDGVADDTAAIQRLLDLLISGRESVAYFPPGQYRITKSLTLVNCGGVLLVGHGRESVLVWDGEAGGSLYVSNGVHRSRFEGLAFDGRGKAGACVEHNSQTRYETHLTYSNCAFLNAEFGVAASKNPRKFAAAEVHYVNGLFKNLGTAVLLNEFNDYDHLFDGCLFVDNGSGLVSRRGHFHIRNCHFLGSRETDLRMGSPVHPSSVRWSTSEGSRQFLQMGGPGDGFSRADWAQPFTIQDCLVKGWTNPEGAVFLHRLGPLTLFDTRFVEPPSEAAPVRVLKEGASLVLSGNAPEEAPGLFSSAGAVTVNAIPKGSEPPSVSAGTAPCFFTEEVDVSGRLFDARRDFGAVGDGKADDTKAVQAAIEAAREHGRRALAYLPSGTYRVTAPLRVEGRDYRISGSGHATKILSAGSPDDAVVLVHDPENLEIQHMVLTSVNDGPLFSGAHSPSAREDREQFFNRKTEEDRRLEKLGNVKIRQTGSGAPSSIFYNDLGMPSHYSPVPGLQLAGLSDKATVRLGVNFGHLHLQDSGQATVVALGNYGRLVVEGTDLPKTGLAGLLYLNDVHRDFAVTVKDNQDLVVADFYHEQNERHAFLAGGARREPGYVTLGMSKLSAVFPGFVKIDDYEGRIWIGGGGIMSNQPGASYEKNPLFLEHSGTRPLDFVLAGNFFFSRAKDQAPPVFDSGPGLRLSALGNLYGPGGRVVPLPEVKAQGWEAASSKALDDFRRLGAANILLNYPASK